MTSELSQMLDELMGKNRNAAPDDKGHDLHWGDKDVCKHFLCGFCPAELFTNTRSDLGPCQKIHDEGLRKAYEQSSRYMRMNYEEDFLHYLTQCMTDVERRIRRNHQRLQLSEEKNQKPVTPNKDVEEQIGLLTQRIEELLQKIEQLGNEGNIEEAQGVMKLCDQLKDDREQLYNQQKGNVGDQYSVQEKQMEVCEVCGAFLIVGDAQSRVDDHLMGKQHMGYAKIKAQVEELKEKLKKRDEAPPPQPREESGKKDDRDYDRHRDERKRSRSHERKDRDRDRYDSRHRRDDYRRDRHRHDDRRDSGRHRDRDRDGRSSDYHSRSRDDRDSRKSSHRSRSRDRDRDRRQSRKHSRPRSRSRERKDHKKSRRSDSQDRKPRNEGGKMKDRDGNNRDDSGGQDNNDYKTKDGVDGNDSQVHPPGTEGDQ